PILKQQEWIISWSPSSGTSPITYYYNITTDSKAFISGKTNDTNLILTGAKNYTTYNVSLYAQNAFGKSKTLTQQIKTLGPPLINRNTISVDYQIDPKLGPYGTDIYGDTNVPITRGAGHLNI